MRMSKTAAALAGLILGWSLADAGPPPVLRDLGRVNPTPVPTEKSYQRRRLISLLTVQNGPEGDTIVTFEASDVAQGPDGKFRPIASQRYSLSEVKERYTGLRDVALKDLRRLEEALLQYVEAVGGPRERPPEKRGDGRPK